MNLNKQVSVIALALITVLTTTVFIVSGQNIQAEQSSASSNARESTIEGAGGTEVRARNCTTGVPGAASLRGLFTFNKGGTMSEFGVGPGSSPALRSPGHGVWQGEQAGQNYSHPFHYNPYERNGVS